MEQIASQSAMSKRTLYKYFPVKEALLERLLKEQLAKGLARGGFRIDGQAGFRCSVLRLLHGFAQWCEQHTDCLLPYIRHKFATFDPGAALVDDKGLVPVWKALIVSTLQ